MRARPALVLLAEALSEGSQEALVLVDRRQRPHLVCAGEPVPERLGHPREELLAHPLEYVHPGDVDDLRRAFLATMDMEGSIARVEFRARHVDGHWVPMTATLANHFERADLGAIVMRLAFASTEESPASGPSDASPSWRAAGMATHHDLTVAISGALDQHRKGRARGFTLVMVELKDFRRVRNSFPRAVVEQLAFQIAERCEPLLGERDLFAHVGSGMFAILMKSIAGARKATRAANRFARALERPFEVAGTPMKLAPLFGLATTERDYDDAEAMIRDASTAIGKAERGRGRRRIAAFQTQFRSEERDRLMLVADMSQALENDEYHLAYQPIINLRDGSLLGFEALCRWRHPSRGDISPGTFIPLAEETGFIEPLGEWVLRTACRQMASWRKKYDQARRMTMSVNVSSAQLTNDELLDIVEDAMRKSDLPPEHLRLELTESMVLEDVEAAAAAVARLRLYGVTFSLDDFGTGYSSLGLLHRLDYEVLKIDRSFVSGDWATNRKIITAIIDMAHGLGMKVVAEGVETTAQAAALTGLDCDAAQGFLYSTPLSADAASRLLASGKRFDV